MAMASAMKLGQAQTRGSVRAVVVMCIVVVVLALGMFGTANAAGDQAGHEGVQTTHKSSASTLAFEQQSLFECPCSNQFCDDATWKFCSCNVNVCSCSCHNSAETKVPGGATIQLLPKP